MYANCVTDYRNSLMQTDKQESANIYNQVVTLPRAGRALLVGMTGSGKTTLKNDLSSLWLRRYPRGRLLIIDSKPRYRAEWQVTGLTAAPLYRKWKKDKDAFVPGSYVIPIDGNYKRSMDVAFKHTRIVIVQGGMAYWEELLECARCFYEDYSARSGPRLMDVDELSDFFEVRKIGGILWQALRSGRELGVGMVVGTQRPKYVPRTVLTETDRVYLFKQKSEDDLKHLQKEGGIPKTVQSPDEFYEFRYFDCMHKGYPNGELFRLAKR